MKNGKVVKITKGIMFLYSFSCQFF